MVPEQVAQPPLGDPREVDSAGPPGPPPTEVLDQDVSLLSRLAGRHVERFQAADDVADDAGNLTADRLAEGRIAVQVEFGQRAQGAPAAVVGQILHPGQLPLPERVLGVSEQAPPDLGPQRRTQATEVDLRGPQHRGGGRAPPAERLLIGVLDGDGEAAALISIGPLRGQPRSTRVSPRPVLALVPSAQPER